MMMEVKVPPKCNPILVAFPSDNGNLRWVEKPSNKDTVMTWGIEEDPLKVFQMVLEEIKTRSSEWSIIQSDLDSAVKRMNDLGIDEVESDENLVYAKDVTLFGSMILSGGKVFPVIHNAPRAISILERS
jgi:hypothetical protein